MHQAIGLSVIEGLINHRPLAIRLSIAHCSIDHQWLIANDQSITDHKSGNGSIARVGQLSE
jgi:hypothetical protein